jgi:hypothetical protein
LDEILLAKNSDSPSTGNLDKATDLADNQIMAVCAFVALDNLISLGAKSLNHDRLVERLEQLSI